MDVLPVAGERTNGDFPESVSVSAWHGPWALETHGITIVENPAHTWYSVEPSLNIKAPLNTEFITSHHDLLGSGANSITGKDVGHHYWD